MKVRFAGFQSVRHDRLLQETRHDPYQATHKPPEPTACPQCGPVFHEGRWQWLVRPAQAREEMCPACRSIHDEFRLVSSASVDRSSTKTATDCCT